MINFIFSDLKIFVAIQTFIVYINPERLMVMNEILLLKKYSNRRLYDTEKSAYVTLDHVMQAIRQGRRVAVVDAKSGEDVTAFILTQIVLEESRKKNSLLPVPLLHLIIQYGENILSEFFEKYLEQTIKNYLSYKAMADDQYRKWLNLGMDLSALTKQSMAALPAFQPFFDPIHDPDQSVPKDKK
ncbi:MAG: polyhydroxyalkanoate synthesis regulator DNA-binding domain-containing protein [Syntrophales bacterium]|nr:polyhydroxyalkanoate synthesis regulator DNA-binding domain-containing protein [Syntrophales bacterium]